MTDKKQEILNAILKQGMLPLFYEDSEAQSIEILRTLYGAGIRVFEYTNRGKSALQNFKKLIEVRDAEMPDLYLGIGTIKSVADAKAFIEAKTDFIVAPVVNPSVALIANQADMLFLYLTEKKANARLIKKDTIFEIIMIQSCFIKPYHIQRPKPAKSTASIPNDTLSAFFSFKTFSNCGNNDTAVAILANIPITVINCIMKMSKRR